jgi:hypothetical protein
MLTWVLMKSWPFWLGLIIGIIFIMWLLWGGKKYEFIGLNPLSPSEDNTNYIDQINSVNSLNPPFFSYPKPNPPPTNVYPDYNLPLPMSYNGSSLNNNNINNNNIMPFSLDNNISSSNNKHLLYNNIPLKINKEKNYHKFIEPVHCNSIIENTCSEEHVIDNTPVIPNEIISKQVPVSTRNYPKGSKGEEICRQVLESIYNSPFPRVRPDFLKNPETGHNLELDCYSDLHKIACEYNGEQHYVFPNKFHQNEHHQNDINKFYAQIRRDQYKINACDANGVYLITVPYNIPHHLIRSYITSLLPENIAYRMNHPN